MLELKVSDYTSLWYRFKDLKIEIPESEDRMVAAVDSTGIKFSNRGEWLRRSHWRECRGWIKVHVAVDVKNEKLLSLEVTDKRTADPRVFATLKNFGVPCSECFT